MVGFAGGIVDDNTISDAISSLTHESWYTSRRVESGNFSATVVEHEAGRHLIYQSAGRIGFIYGEPYARDGSDLDPESLFDRVIEDPESVLPALDGPFVLVCGDRHDNEWVVATDKIGSYSCYYSLDSGFSFASEVTALLPTFEDPSLNLAAVADLVMLHFVWGDKTLVSEVSAVPPASYVSVSDDDVQVRRYWDFDYGTASPSDYAKDLTSAYRTAVDQAVPTDEENLGAWLSGGLDSRTLAAALTAEGHSFRTFTFDANPGGGANIGPARAVARTLGVENDITEFTPDAFVETIADGVALTDGMTNWVDFHNLPFVLNNLSNAVDSFVNASAQGEFLGEDIALSYLTDDCPILDRLWDRYALMDEDQFESLVPGAPNPRNSLAAAVDRSDQPTAERTVLDVTYRNFYPNFHYRSRLLTRSQVPVIIPFANTDFLDCVTHMPHEHRWRNVKFTGGNVPHAVSSIKLEVVRQLDQGIERVPYERTKITPSQPLLVHTARYLISQLRNRLSDSASMYGEWYRTNDTLRKYVDDLLDECASRPYVDADTVIALREEHHAGGADNIRTISALTTVELFVQQFLD